MSTNRKLVKKINKFYKQLSQKFLCAIKKQIVWLLRTLFVPKRRRATVNAGFILPTLAMVALIVVLLTSAILFRSFERSKNASNVRVNQAVLNAAIPAIDRATAKLEQLLNDPSLPRSTPTDIALYDVIKQNTKYDFGDETRLKLAYDINGNTTIANGTTNGVYTLENDETLNTAWKFPVDTDNNGKFDSFVLYSLYFRSPSRDNSNQFTRPRNPLEARTPPMDKSQVGGACSSAIGTSASLVGDSSWYKSGGNLAKSFFVYTVNVPIDAMGTLSTDKYETYKGNKGFSALEYQQDRERIPVNNQAVWYEHDLEITPGSTLNLNGAIHTNGNLLAGGQFNDRAIIFRQVSSKNSCYYDQNNGKITVGGNIGTGNVSDTTNKGSLVVDRFIGYKVTPTSEEIGGSSDNKSTTENGGSNVGHNDAAYDKRISKMKNEALSLCTNCATKTTVADLKTAVAGVTRYPEDVRDNFRSRVDPSTGIDVPDVPTAYKILGDEIENYLRNRTRRVSFSSTEVPKAIPTDAEALGDYATNPVFSGTGVIEVPARWREITTTYTGLTLSPSKLPATEPQKQKQDGIENYTGDRVLAGNSLPAYWKDSDGTYATGDKRQPVDDGTTKWDSPTTNQIARTRASQIQPQLSLGVTDRNDFWEKKAAEDNSANPLANSGGLRVITGAGIYVDDNGIAGDTPSYARSTNSFLATPTLDANLGDVAGQMPTPAKFKDAGTEVDNIVVWPDTMPMTGPPGETRKGDLLMRSTAVYHYKDNAGTTETPIACVSSYYDPTNATTAAASNNGKVYTVPNRTIDSTTLTILKRQARLVFPNGRITNEPLRNAMQKYTSNSNAFTNFTMADYSAVDTALCAIGILNGTLTADTSKIADNTIQEKSFLDAREVKALQKNYADNTKQGQYDLELEQRQPLEIRVTEIDLGVLASKTIGTSEYLLPKSGIIYATRDDALSDLSYASIMSDADRLTNTDKLNSVKLFSQTDFKLDPTRRPNGIRLINGSNLARGGTNSNTYDSSEKGLILVSNLPVYVKGDLNLHKTPSGADTNEFSDTSNSFYDQATPDTNFACRPGRAGCPSTDGDLWRPSTIIADSITLLSDNFRDGFRDQGDYDLRNNAITTPDTDLVNNFVTTADWVDTTGSPPPGYPKAAYKTSYLANGVTPIQRRANFNEYLMEVCTKVPASQCDDSDPNDWKVFEKSGGTPTAKKATEVLDDITINTGDFVANSLVSGTTNKAPDQNYLRYRRRVAFERDTTSGELILRDSSGTKVASGGLPVPLGIDSSGNVIKVHYGTSTFPRSGTTALWFKTTNDATNPTGSDYYGADKPLFIKSWTPGIGQPQLVPVLQIFSPEGQPNGSSNLPQGSEPRSQAPGIQNQWVQKVTNNTTFNSALVSGNSPSRPDEESAGLQNFVRFLEYWGGDGETQYTAKIKGSFIEFKRSAYATAPFANVLRANASATADATNNLSFFAYPAYKYLTNKGSPQGTLPYYGPPTRDWGFDVALLSQLPDLFAQRFTVPPSGPPAEFFREVSKDDSWIKTLLCAAQGSNYTVPSSYRPSSCPTFPS